MTIHFQREIDHLKQKILLMAGDVEVALERAIRSLRDWNPQVARSVIDSDADIDRFEVEIEEECLKLLALHQPVAIDLRFVVAVLKINNDLERIADMAVNISERMLDLGEGPRISIPNDLTGMVNATQSMVKASLDALVNLDVAIAHRVIAEDDDLDAAHARMYDYVISHIQSDPGNTGRYISLLSISRQLERTGDLVTNIAEDVLYMVSGEIVRHRL